MRLGGFRAWPKAYCPLWLPGGEIDFPDGIFKAAKHVGATAVGGADNGNRPIPDLDGGERFLPGEGLSAGQVGLVRVDEDQPVGPAAREQEEISGGSRARDESGLAGISIGSLPLVQWNNPMPRVAADPGILERVKPYPSIAVAMRTVVATPMRAASGGRDDSA